MSEPKMCEKHVSDKEKQAIMKIIEKNTEKAVEIACKSGLLNADPKKVDDSMNLLVDIMKVGDKVFQEKMGRNMTYSEMREMYG